MNKKVLIGLAVGAGVLLTVAAAVAGGMAYVHKKLDAITIDSVKETNN